MNELLVLLGFGVLQISFHSVEKLKDKCSFFKNAEKYHWIVWLGHPVVVHTIRDYAIHIVIYSGKIIGAH